MWLTFCYLRDGTCEEVIVWEVINASNEIITEYFISIFHFKTPILNWKALWIRKIAISRVKLSKIAPKGMRRTLLRQPSELPETLFSEVPKRVWSMICPWTKEQEVTLRNISDICCLLTRIYKEKGQCTLPSMLYPGDLFSVGVISRKSMMRLMIINHSIWWKISCFPVNLISFWEPRIDANELEKLFLSFI